MVNTVIKRVMPVILAMAGLFVVGVGLLILGSIPNQMRKDRDYERKLRPSIEFIESFERSKNRLPTDQEFDARPSAGSDGMVDLVTNNSADPSFKAHGGKTERDFCVRVWRGESWTVYYSWSREFDIVNP